VYPLFCTAFAEPGRNGWDNWLPDTLPLLACLIKSDADIYLPLNKDETLIHFLFEHPQHEVLEVLVQEPCASRINFDRRDQQGRTVLMAACDWKRDLPAHRRKSRQAPKIYKTGPPLEILNLGADATLVDPSGKTALHHLLSNPGFPDVVLLDFINRAEVAPTLLQKDGQGYSPLHHALGTLRPAVCEALLAKGADLLESDPQGRTALHYIASQCLLQDRETSPFGRHNHELSADLFDGCVSLWQKYLSLGGSINAVDDAGETPLHAYLSMLDPQREQEKTICHVEHYKSFFPENSDVDVLAVNKAGETMLHKIAARPVSGYLLDGHDKALFLMMMDKGLDPLKEDTKGRSALDVASACEKDDIVGLLGRK
jgi:ankyrin repeat protein